MLLSFFISLFIVPSFAEDINSTAFDAGIRLMQEQKYNDAMAVFKSAYSESEPSAALLYNWGLAAYKSQKVGYAVGLWRKALSINPDLTVARQALNFHEETSPPAAFAQDPTLWQQLKLRILSRASLNKLIIVTWIFLVTSGFLFIRYLGQRKRALRNERPLPNIPTVAAVFATLFLFMFLLSTAKAITLFEVHATVTANNVPLRTGPSTEDNILFELSEGLSVEIKRVNMDWVLVSVASGSSGWLPKEYLLQHSGGKALW